MEQYLKEFQKQFMPEDTKAGMIQGFLDGYSRNMVCSKMLYKEALNHPFDEPIWEKSNLTLEEAAAYSGIGINKLRKLSDDENCPFVLWIGSKRLIKRRQLDEYTGKMYSL